MKSPVESDEPPGAARPEWLQHHLGAVLTGGITATLAALWISRGAAVERDAVIAAALFLLLGLLLALLVKHLVAVQGDLLLTLVIFLPLLVYLILSGKIAAFTAGGVNVTLVVPLNEVSIPNRQVVPDASSGREHSKCAAQSYTNSPSQQAQFLPADATGSEVTWPAVYLTLALGGCTATPDAGSGGYALEDVRRWVEEDARSGDFKFLIVVDGAGEFLASIDSLSVAKLLSSDEGAALVDAINDGSLQPQDASAFPGIAFDAVPDSASNIEALQEMERRNLDALVVIYGDGHIKGVLSREQVLSSMMLALASSGD